MSLRFAIVLAVVVASASLASAQYPVEWAATFSTPSPTGGNADRVMSSAAASNGNVFLAVFSSATSSGTTGDLRVLCYSSTGVLLSSTSISAALSTAASVDFGRPVIAVDSNDFAYTLWTRGYLTYIYEAELTKTDAAGNISWTRTVDGFATKNESQIDLVIDSSDNCLVATEPHVVIDSALSKFDTNGTRLWSTPWMPTSGRWCSDLALTPGDGVVGIGWGNSSTGAPGVAVAFDSAGVQRFLTYIDLGPSTTELFYNAAVDPAGNIGVTGHTYSPLGSASALILLDPAGTILWQREWLPPQGSANHGEVAFASDGTLWTACWIYVAPHFLRGQVLHYDRAGQLIGEAVWELGGLEAQLSPGTAGDMLLCSAHHAESAYEAVLIQFDAACQRTWAWRAESNQFLSAQTLTRAPNDRVVVSGHFSPLVPVGSLGDVRTVQLELSAAPRSYCVAETNSLGCTPNVVFNGLSRASATDGFTILATGVLNQRSGLLFYGTTGAANVPFLSGTLCVQPPLARTLLVNTGGNVGASDCSGAVALDMNAFASGALGGSPSPVLGVAGTRVWTQAWSRDPGSPSGTNLSSALTYVVLP